MLIYKYNSDSIIFSVEQDGNKVPIINWSANEKEIYLGILDELIDNGQAFVAEDYIEVSNKNIHILDYMDQQMLGLPGLYPYEIYVRNEGNFNAEMRLHIEYMSFCPDGTVFQSNRNGLHLTVDGREYLLSFAQYELVNKVEEFNVIPAVEKTVESNLLAFNQIKTLGKSAKASFTEFLTEQEVVVPDKIQLQIDSDDIEALSLNAELRITHSNNEYQASKDNFKQTFNRRPRAKQRYRTQDKSKMVHVVFTDEQKENLDKIKGVQNAIKKEGKGALKDFIDNLDNELDTELIDVKELYSDRVIKIGLYEPKFYPFICKYKSSWLPGIQVENRVNGTDNVFVRNDDELAELEDKLIIAEENAEESIQFKGVELPIKQARKLLEKTKDAKQAPITEENANQLADAGQKKVLIIEENAEELAFKKEAEVDDVGNQYELEVNDNLAAGIKLKEHQEEGVAWLQYLQKNNLAGCLLADDMGLGKTLQILYLIDWHARFYNPQKKPYLIVAPISLLENWECEYIKFFNPPAQKVQVLGSSDFPKKYNQEAISILQSSDVVLTNYETVRSLQLNLGAVDFAITILDEAQRVKTPGTMVTNAVKALKSDFKIAMTGTPVENSMVDLWCIMDYCVPGLLGNAKAFSKEYEKPLALNESDDEKSIIAQRLRSKLNVYFKRRLKSDVAKDLPNKYSKKVPKEMPEIQKTMYRSVLNRAIQNELDNEERRAHGESAKNIMLEIIQELRNIVDHPYASQFNLEEYSVEELVESSGKLQATLEVLGEIKDRNEKVIIFTHTKKIQRMLRKVCYEYFQILPRIINGDTPSSVKEATKNKLSRQQTIDVFQKNEGFNIIIMSPIAAGMGLNVVGANNVIHYSRHWNPAKENQATDRVYRIGQKRDVFVYYPISHDDEIETFDIVLDELLNRKNNLANLVMYPTDRAEVTVKEMSSKLFGASLHEVSYANLVLSDIDKFDPYYFEAFVAAYYRKKGYEVTLTPKSNDYGADVIAINNLEALLIQAKQSGRNIGSEGVNEIYGAVPVYNDKCNKEFTPVLFTNSQLTSQASERANAARVKVVDRVQLVKDFASLQITQEDCSNEELARQ